ncbi:MAG TPA: Rrf2 family transcriptional regulator [Tepidisphaeraceae bacterium]|jgi:Rrf2 family protein
MFSQTSDYALRVIVLLAGRIGAVEQAATTRQIAQATRVPEGYLAKVLQNLVRAGMVKSQRGLHGGFVLDRDPAQLTVFDVIESVEPVSRIRTCPLGLAAHGTRLCALHRRLDGAMELVEAAFRDTTIAEILSDASTKGGSKPLCDVSNEDEPVKTSRTMTLSITKK